MQLRIWANLNGAAAFVSGAHDACGLFRQTKNGPART